MAAPINLHLLSEYAKNFSENETEFFFKNNHAITGPQLLNFTPVKQVNFFILKNLYDAWQHEAARIRSPYFNYVHPDVKKALGQFMNFLSRHIYIKRPDFEPILQQAVADTLHLLLHPYGFFNNFLSAQGNVVKKNNVRDLARYLKINTHFLKVIESEFDKHQTEELPVTELKELLSRTDLVPNDVGEVVSQFNEVLPLDLSALQNAQPAPEEPEAPEADFFSEVAAHHDQPTPQYPATPEPVVNAPADEIPTNQPHNTELDQPQTPAEQPQPAEHKETLHDKLSQNSEATATILDKMQANIKTNNTQQRQSIKKAFPIHEKFMYINDLFEGDNIAWSMALQQLDSMDTAEQARELLNNDIAPRYNWDNQNQRVTEFLSIVEKHFD